LPRSAIRRIAWSELDQMTTVGVPTIERFLVCKSLIDNARRIPMLLSLIEMIRTFRNYQRTVAELSELSDRELADIGLNRSDIPRVAAGNWSRW
jgi:uncharacterized protein YjiS (DUF1127 family)